MEMLDEIVSEFLVESHESLDQLDRDLLALESASEDRELMSSVFRTIHTIKGTSGFLAFQKLERLTHVGESLLVPLRDGNLQLDNDIADSLLSMVDAVRSMLGSIEQGQGEGDESYDDLIARLEELRNPEASAQNAERKTAGESGGAEVEDAVVDQSDDAEADAALEPTDAGEEPPEAVEVKAPRKRAAKKKTTRKKTTSKASSAKSGPKKKSTTSKRAAKKKSPVVADDSVDSGSEEPVSEAEELQQPPAVAAESTSPAATECAEAAPAAAANVPSSKTDRGNDQDRSPQRKKETAIADSTVRIDVHLLDKLMNLVGELVLARNQVMQFCHDTTDGGMSAAAHRINLITTELQEGVMKTRMQPIRNAWSKLPRVVRDLSHSCGKEVQLMMEGADTELDKTILEAIRDPLTHIVRNSVDHGIESPQERIAAGKPAEGTLLLRAFHEGGQVNIEITDDGGGIDTDRVRRSAVSKGMLSEDEAAALSEGEALQLILQPGFSTAAKVTNVSGRGVGMDVVKNNVEKIGGSLDIQTKAGQGTTLRIKIPLTLAIVPALVISTAGDRYCIPQVSLLELVRLDGDRVRDEIEVLHSVPVHRLRGRLLPLVYLDEQLGLRPPRTDKERAADESVNIVVLQAEGRQFGLVVCEINDTQEIVVKPLGTHLKDLPMYAGSTIMGDGTVALILDVIGIAQRSNVLASQPGSRSAEAAVGETEHHDDRDSWLIVEWGEGVQAAIPLSSVARLEEFDVEQIEQAGRRQVVQYRGEIMPLTSATEFGQLQPNGGAVSVVVYNDNGRNVGIAVGQIVDIVKRNRETEGSTDGDSRIISGRVTQVIDLARIAATV